MSSTRHSPVVHQLIRTRPRGEADRVRLLSWDGRLDNVTELTRRLGGAPGAWTSDAALAREAYERWGVDGLSALIGDWSLVIDDPAADAVVLASDFMGVRPLYYHVSRERVIWSSNLAALVAATSANTLDEVYAIGLLRYGGMPTRTPYVGIQSVPAGAAVIVGDLATDNDARRLRRSGAPIVQITTGTLCHLEADMIARACKEIDLDEIGRAHV